MKEITRLTKDDIDEIELTPSQIQEIEMFRQMQEDERDKYERLKDNEPQDPDK